MLTPLKLAANRRNAQRSTGPRTAAGKLRASRNALTHGVWATAPVVPGEDPAAWDAHRAGILASLAPAGHLEAALVERAALLLWRLGRLARYETLTTAADLWDAVLPPPADPDRLDAHLAGRGTDLDRGRTAVRRRLRDVQEELGRLDPAAAALPGVQAAPEADPVLRAVAVTLLGEARELVCRYRTTREAPPPGRHLLRLLGEADPPKRIAWTAGLVRHGLEYYAGCVDEPVGWLTRKLAARLAKRVRGLGRRDRMLRTRRAGLKARAGRAAAGRAAAALLPAAGRDERIIRYEAHLHKLLTATLQELDRLQAARPPAPEVCPESDRVG